MSIKDKIRQWMENKLYILPYKDPEDRIFTYTTWVPPEEIELYKKILDKYKEDFPGIIILASDMGTNPIILWDKDNTSKFVRILCSEDWSAAERELLRKCALEIFMLKKRIPSLPEREEFYKKKKEENGELLFQITDSPDFTGEIEKFVKDTLLEIKQPEYEYSIDSSEKTFGRVRSVSDLEREKRILTRRLNLFKSLYFRNNGIKRSNKFN